MVSYETIKFEKKNGIAFVTINRPKALNALNAKALDELEAVFKKIASDEEIYGVILTGEGEKAFVAGADISEIQKLDPLSGRNFAKRGQKLFLSIENLGKPVIAAVNGFALGGGCELAMACTMRIASENARFGQPEVKLGVIPGYGGTQRLPRLVGKGRALELLLTGRMVDPNEALSMGLVNRVVPAEKLLEEAEGLLQVIHKNSPLACSLCIDAVNRGFDLPLEEGLRLEADLFGTSTGSKDMKEGTSAFLEKRKPNWA